MTDSTPTSALVPMKTPTIGTVVKNVKNARIVPANAVRPPITPTMIITMFVTWRITTSSSGSGCNSGNVPPCDRYVTAPPSPMMMTLAV